MHGYILTWMARNILGFSQAGWWMEIHRTITKDGVPSSVLVGNTGPSLTIKEARHKCNVIADGDLVIIYPVFRLRHPDDSGIY